jgi:hypothetical protein
MDLRGLAALFGKINAMLSESPSAAEESESLDLFGLSRFLQRRGDTVRAQNACAEALAMGLPIDIRPKAQKELALIAKRRGEFERAAKIWEEMVADSCDEVHACEQLAIYHERRVKDIGRAMEFAKLGLAKLKHQQSIFLRGSRDAYLAARCARQEKTFKERLARLERKVSQSSPARRRDVPVAVEPKARPALW